MLMLPILLFARQIMSLPLEIYPSMHHNRGWLQSCTKLSRITNAASVAGDAQLSKAKEMKLSLS